MSEKSQKTSPIERTTNSEWLKLPEVELERALELKDIADKYIAKKGENIPETVQSIMPGTKRAVFWMTSDNEVMSAGCEIDDSTTIVIDSALRPEHQPGGEIHGYIRISNDGLVEWRPIARQGAPIDDLSPADKPNEYFDDFADKFKEATRHLKILGRSVSFGKRLVNLSLFKER